MKKLSLLLALCLLLSLLPVTASAATVVDSGTCGENLTWTLDSDGLLTITGTGDMVKEEGQSVWGWTNYMTSKVRSVVVGSGVTSIGERAFSTGWSLKSVALPDSVKRIEANAFTDCFLLTEIRLPEALEYLAVSAFSECSRLDKYTVPEGNLHFKNDGAGALYSMDGTVLYALPANFSGEYAIAEGVKVLYPYTFLFHNDLTGLYIPASVETIEDKAIYKCGNLKAFRVSSENPYFEHDENGLLYSKGKLGLVRIPGAKIGTVKLADTTVWIEPNAASYCSMIREVVLPESLEIIEEYAFYQCSGLEKINLPDKLSFIGRLAFYHCEKLQRISIPGNVKLVSEDCFNGCYALESVELHGGVEIIGAYAFAWCKKLESISLPEGVEQIASGAFSGCETFKEARLPESLKRIDGYAFNNCPLETVVYAGLPSQWQQVTVRTYGNDPLLNARMEFLRDGAGFTAVKDGWNLINVQPSFGYSDYYFIDFSQYYAAGASFFTVGKSVLSRFTQDWNGNCFGLSVLAAAYYNGQIDLRPYFQTEGDTLNEFGYENVIHNTYGGDTLQGKIYCLRGNKEVIRLIERVQCSQYSSQVAAAEVFALDTDYSEVLAYLNQDHPAPLVIAVKGESPRSPVEGHAMVTDTTYKPIDLGNGQYMIICYDSNAPKLTNPLAGGASRYEYVHSCVILDTTDGMAYYYLNNNLEIKAENVFYNRGVRFYDVRKLDPDFFAGMDLNLLGENGVFVEAGKYFSVTNTAGDVLFTIVDGVPTVYSEDVEYIFGAGSSPAEEGVSRGYLALPAGTYTYSSEGDAGVVQIGEGFRVAYEINAKASVTVEAMKLTVKDETDAQELTLKAAVENGEGTVIGSVEGVLSDAGTVSIGVDVAEKVAQVAVEGDAQGLKASAVVDGKEQPEKLRYEHDHLWGEWVQEKAPNAQENGQLVRRCGLCGSKQSQEIPNNPFPDVGMNHSFKKYILWGYYEGIVSGDKQGNFNPDNTVTRGQFILMLWRAAGKPEPTQFQAFPDVSANSSFYKAVCWAVEEGITNGQKDGSFGVNDPCTRGHVALFLYRYANSPAIDGSVSFPDVTGGTYYKAVCWAAEEGITSGQKDGTFGVGNPCKRMHVMKFLYLFICL